MKHEQEVKNIPTKTILSTLIPLQQESLLKQGFKAVKEKLQTLGGVNYKIESDDDYVQVEVDLQPNEEQTTDQIINTMNEIHTFLPDDPNGLGVEQGVERFNSEGELLHVHRDTDVWVPVKEIPEALGHMYLTF